MTGFETGPEVPAGVEPGSPPSDSAAAPAGPGQRPGLSLRLAAGIGAILVLAFGGAAAWAVVTNGELERTRQTLGSIEADLTSTSATLASTKDELDTDSASLADERGRIKASDARITVLEFQIERKGACIAAQTANLAEFRRILALERENFGRTSTGSTWAKVNAASDKALDLAIDYLAKSYSSAADGSYSTANSWLSKSNAQIRISNRNIDAANEEIDSINAASDAINAANDALYDTLDATTSTCGR